MEDQFGFDSHGLRIRTADDLLNYFSVHSPPVDVFALAANCGIVVWRVSNPQWDGAIDMGPPAIIYVDEAASHTRARFTVAHELGHFVLHRRVQRAFRDRFSSQGLEPREIQANGFAADLLMPAHWVRAYAVYESVDQMAQRFQVSKAAMAIRLRGLGFPNV